jgi:hypothetical protein
MTLTDEDRELLEKLVDGGDDKNKGEKYSL